VTVPYAGIRQSHCDYRRYRRQISNGCVCFPRCLCRQWRVWMCP